MEIDGEPCIKLSNEIAKTTIPGAKSIYRLVSSADVMLLDLLVPFSHAPPEVGERILCRHPFDHQKRAYVTPSAVQCFCADCAPPDRTPRPTPNRYTQNVTEPREPERRALRPAPYIR